MALALNTSNVNVDSQGKITFSGMASGINATQAVDAIMKAKDVKVQSLTTRVDGNTAKIKAFTEFRDKLKMLNTSVSSLYGRMTADNSFDAFARKTVSTTSHRINGVTGTPSVAADLVSVSSDNRAAIGTHAVEFRQMAKGEKIRSARVADATAALGLVGSFTVGAQPKLVRYSSDALSRLSWGSVSLTVSIGTGASAQVFTQSAANAQAFADAFNASAAAASTGYSLALGGDGLVVVGPADPSAQVPVALAVQGAAAPLRAIESINGDAGVSVQLTSADTLQDLRNKINNAASSSQTPAVSASIVSVQPGENYLVLAANEAVGDLRFSGVSDSLGNVSSLALFGTPSSRAIAVADPTTIQSLAVTISRPGTDQVVRDSISLAGAASGVALAAKLQSSLRATDGGRGDISVAYDGAMGKLVVTDKRGGTISRLASDPVGAADAAQAAVGSAHIIQSGQRLQLMLDGQLIERQTNNVTDLLTGVTLTCHKAEPGTEIVIGVGRDSQGLQSEIIGFLKAYNDVAEFIKTQTAYDTATGRPTANAVLARSSVVRGLGEWFQSNLRISAYGTSAGTQIKTLGDMGIAVDQTSTSPTFGELVIDQAKLTGVIQSNPNAVRQIFAMTPTTDDPRLPVVGFDKDTAAAPGGTFVFRYTPASGGTQASATLIENGAPQEVAINGDVLTVRSGSAKGLVLLLSGGAALETRVSLSNGIGSQVFGRLARALAVDTGELAVETQSLTDSNSSINGQITKLKERIGREREQMLARFSRMEAALSKMNSLKQQITSIVNSMSGGSNN